VRYHWKVKLTLTGRMKNTVTATVIAASYEEARVEARESLGVHHMGVARYEVTRLAPQ